MELDLVLEEIPKAFYGTRELEGWLRSKGLHPEGKDVWDQLALAAMYIAEQAYDAGVWDGSHG